MPIKIELSPLWLNLTRLFMKSKFCFIFSRYLCDIVFKFYVLKLPAFLNLKNVK